MLRGSAALSHRQPARRRGRPACGRSAGDDRSARLGHRVRLSRRQPARRYRLRRIVPAAAAALLTFLAPAEPPQPGVPEQCEQQAETDQDEDPRDDRRDHRRGLVRDRDGRRAGRAACGERGEQHEHAQPRVHPADQASTTQREHRAAGYDEQRVEDQRVDAGQPSVHASLHREVMDARVGQHAGRGGQASQSDGDGDQGQNPQHPAAIAAPPATRRGFSALVRFAAEVRVVRPLAAVALPRHAIPSWSDASGRPNQPRAYSRGR